MASRVGIGEDYVCSVFVVSVLILVILYCSSIVTFICNRWENSASIVKFVGGVVIIVAQQYICCFFVVTSYCNNWENSTCIGR